MKTKTLLAGALAALLLLASPAAFAQFRVIGYLPSWTGNVSDLQYGKLTHVNYAFLLPTATGGLQPIENPAKLQSLVSAAHTNGVKVLISVGGWNNGDTSGFESIGGNAGYTTTFTTNLINFVNQYGLDGVDIDWEHPNAGTASKYAALMQQLATQLHSRGKLLTTAVAGGTWEGPGVPSSVFGNVDFMNIMAYDDTAPAHSTYALAAQSITYWKGLGLPASKAVLGLPFYGQPSGETYAALLARGASPTADLFNGVGYNGIPTIKSKTNLAFDQAGGVMIWHLAGDAVGANSLLTAINQVVLDRSTPPATGVATAYKDCNYAGAAVNLPVGDYTLAALQSRGILNDDVSSLKVSSGYEVVLYESDNFSGAALTVGSAGSTCLVGNALGTGNWNDKTTSLKVRVASGTGFSTTLQAEAYTSMSGVQVEATTDTGGGQNVGYIDATDWLAYANVSFPTSGTYTIEYRVASPSGGTISSDLNAGSIQLGNTTIPATGGWQTWTTVSRTVSITAGTYSFGVYAQTGGYNLNWIRITKQGSAREAVAAPEVAKRPVAEQVELYPNPVTDRLQLRTAQSLTGSQFQILNSWGKMVASGSAAAGSIDVAALKPGVYTLVLTAEGGTPVSRRFVK